MDNHPISEQMEEKSQFQVSGEEQPDLSPIEKRETDEDLISAVAEEIKNLRVVLEGIDIDLIPPVGYVAMAGAVILNLLCLVSNAGTYMVLWILASLYFYLSYPLLPLILFLIPHLLQRPVVPVNQDAREQFVSRIKTLHLIKNHKIVLQLVIRFFILSIMPLTFGMVFIYGLSLFFAVILGGTGVIPSLTSLLIVVQCFGILIFYLDLSLLKRQFSFFTRTLVVINRQNWVRYLLMAIVGVLVVTITSFATIILLITIFLPGFTLGVYVDAAGFIQNRTNLWILLLLVSQFIWMQYLQSILSRRIASSFGKDLSSRLNQAQVLLIRKGDTRAANNEDSHPDDIVSTQMVRKEILSLLIESRIHTITRSHMAGLFPTYSIGVDIKEVFRIKALENLSGIFNRK
ncbi:MAG: hypothetical protein CVV33_07120 [Methanomicrobiales archaeon HGW-Methanomicrobiales-4]|nr:MAG: hypothetical protein CVV33_07120 [Methanomicrobiales archaeon HGW-Methanomicrobiales-4]